MPHKPKQPKTMPLKPRGQVKQLAGEKFGQLEVTVFAGRTKHGHAMWCCRCACLPGCHDCQGSGCSIKVMGTKLVCGKVFSCGCSRTDSEVRRKAALKVPVKVRKARAQAAAQKCKGTTHPPSFGLTLDQAGERLGVANERVIELSREGVIRTCYRGGRIKVSSTDVVAYMSMSLEGKRCPMDQRQ